MLKYGIRWTGIALLATALASPAFAADKKKKNKTKEDKAGETATVDKEGGGSEYTAPYGMAGCGLGSTIIKKDTMVSQITAATLNGTGFQTSAISCSHSSNCQVSKEDLARQEQEVFLTANLHGLEVDLAQGGGDFSFAFAQVLGCDATENYGEFLEVSRSHYGAIFSSEDPKVVYSHYLEALRSSTRLTSGCERIAKI
jgi:hypothetical protein